MQIGDDLYDILKQEFQFEKDVKEEAKKIVLDPADHRTITIDDQTPAEKKEIIETEQEEFIIKSVTSSAVKPEPKEKPKKEAPATKAAKPAAAKEEPAKKAEPEEKEKTGP